MIVLFISILSGLVFIGFGSGEVQEWGILEEEQRKEEIQILLMEPKMASNILESL